MKVKVTTLVGEQSIESSHDIPVDANGKPVGAAMHQAVMGGVGAAYNMALQMGELSLKSITVTVEA